MMAYILFKEGDKNYNNTINDLLFLLKNESWKRILKMIINNNDIDDILYSSECVKIYRDKKEELCLKKRDPDSLSNTEKTLKKKLEEFLKLLSNGSKRPESGIYKLLDQAYNNFGKNNWEIIDLYTGLDQYVSMRSISKIEGDKEDENNLRMFYMIYYGYESYYRSYSLEKIIKPYYGIELLKDGLRIVKGIGVYLTVLLDLLKRLEEKMLRLDDRLKVNENKIKKEIEMYNVEKLPDEKKEFIKELNETIERLKRSNDKNKDEKIKRIMELRLKVTTTSSTSPTSRSF